MPREPGYFPYSDDIIAPNTDGTLASVPTGRENTVQGPQTPRPPLKNKGAIIPSPIGNTDFIDTNTISHAIFAGDF